MENSIYFIIESYVHEFLTQDSKTLIDRHEESVHLNKSCYITRKSIKYITHSRQKDNYSSGQIIEMIIRAGRVIECPMIILPNNNPKYPGSRVSVAQFGTEQVLLVVHMSADNQIFNAFYRDIKRFKRMLVNKKTT